MPNKQQFAVTFREVSILTYRIQATSAAQAEKLANAMRDVRAWDRYPHDEDTEGTNGVESITGPDGTRYQGADGAYRALARENYQRDGEIEIDDNAVVSRGDDNGAYVAAWLWVEGCELCKEALPESGDNWEGLCPGCADRVSNLMDKRKIERDAAIAICAVDGDRPKRGPKPKPTVWVVWRREQKDAAELVRHLRSRAYRACLLADLHDGKPAYFVHVRPKDEAATLEIINRISAAVAQ